MTITGRAGRHVGKEMEGEGHIQHKSVCKLIALLVLFITFTFQISEWRTLCEEKALQHLELSRKSVRALF